MNNRVPNLYVVVAFCGVAIGGYAFFSVYVFLWSDDAALKGDVIGTWKSFAVLAFGFWIGSSSGGKANANPEPHNSDPQPAPRSTPSIPSPEFSKE